MEILKRRPPGIMTLRFLILPVLLFLSGCDYLNFWERQKILENSFQNKPRMETLRELSPESCLAIAGKLVLNRPFDGPLLVVAVSDRFKTREIVASRSISPPLLYYSLFLPEGNYDLSFFADLNKDGFFDGDELVGRTNSGNSISITVEKAEDNALVNGPEIRIDVGHPTTSDLPVHARVMLQSNKYESLDDEFFDPHYGTMGLYRPTEFLAHTQGAFFQLEDYDRNKTMIIFVHGVEGTPRDWKYFVEGLDRKRFQPWFFYYPSGLPLERLGNFLAYYILNMDKTPGNGINRLVIVAHSMGGLVARSAIDRLCRDGKPSYLKMSISLSSPYGGVEAARAGTKTAPVMVPSWRDVATDSPFLENIYRTALPTDLPFHLFFGYRNRSGQSSDGTITLRSQLDTRIQMEAFRIYGYDTTHLGILNDESVRRAFYGILETAVP
ncbi:Putative serine esterase [Syntrophus gentianae]|uniref:Putative serine esterase n=1 Tax=Syntrophus gentianae TaxID=43775 RepID=A0A1H7WNI9_9BACT|nr:alpha/beta hydrolase [Syntrophus gentianae]SEM23060.1 Putative serine esterase [Syntrophus gentianae]